MSSLIFHAVGKPIQQGSMNPGKNGGMYHAKGASLDVWRKERIPHAARVAMTQQGWPLKYGGPVEVGILFRFYSPTKLERSWKDSYPDLDKLERAVLDSLTFAEVLKDDKQVCRFTETDKRWTRDPDKEGALITVTTLN